MPGPVRIFMQYILPPIVAPMLGLAHSLEPARDEIVAGLTDPLLKSGVFHASAEKKLTSPVIDQSEVFPDLANSTFQHNADKAIHRFL